MPVVTTGLKASVLEIFESRQGEGPCVGDSQIFLRFGGCNLVCDYCDTPESIPAKSGTPMTPDEILSRVDVLRKESGASILSLTGGEPLNQTAVLQELLPSLRARGYRIYLETNGSLPGALAKIVSDCDWIAMDFKPES